MNTNSNNNTDFSTVLDLQGGDGFGGLQGVGVGVGLESTRELKINKLIFLDTFDSLLLASYDDLSTEERLTAIIEIMGILDHNTSKGYINDLDLTKYPIISEFLSFFIADESKAEEFIRGNKAMESYKWIYNIIVLNLYLCFLIQSITFLANNSEPQS